MYLNTLEQRVADLVIPIAEELELSLWGVKVIRNPKMTTLQIFIDKESGVTIEDCEKFNSQISNILDVEDLFSSKYYLEVSSPGLDRTLFTFEQVSMYVGREMNIEVSMPIANRKRFRGVLEKIEGDVLYLLVDKEVFEIAYPNVNKAQLIPVFKK
jgi:ribosome maturation factor RimP